MNKNKRQSKKNYINIVIILFILFFIFFIALKCLEKKSSNNTELSYDGLRTVKDVIEYYGSTYISQKWSDEKGYSVDIQMIFKLLPYNEDESSNEQYYNDLLGDVARVLNYKNFIMIDDENNLKVKVICKNEKIDSIIINDIEDYFTYMDSLISLKHYEKINTTELPVTSEILQLCINNNWNTNEVNFGERKSIFNEYYIYSNEGIKVRTIQNKIYNIVFDENYKGNVVNNTYPGMDLNTIQNILGEATFEDDNKNVIGYKGNDIYVFFTENEISVYRIDTSNADDFLKLTDKYLSENYDLLEFMNQLTYMWPDYSDYEYSSNKVFISYPLKGVEIKINYDDTDGILLYNNIRSNLSKIKNYLEDTKFISRLKIDCVFEAEKRRLNEENSLIDKCEQYKKTIDEEKLKIIGESLDYNFYADMDSNNNIYSMKFISLKEENPNRELNDSFDYYLWINSNHFLYSKKGKGIFVYDLTNGIVNRIVVGNEIYELKCYENGILKYDDKEMQLQY